MGDCETGLSPNPVLHRLHRHIAFPEPQGSFSVLEFHRLRGSCSRHVKKESVQWFSTVTFLPLTLR